MLIRRKEEQPGGVREISLEILGGSNGSKVYFVARSSTEHPLYRGEFLGYTLCDKRLCCLAEINGLSTTLTVDQVLALVRPLLRSGQKSALTKLEKR